MQTKHTLQAPSVSHSIYICLGGTQSHLSDRDFLAEKPLMMLGVLKVFTGWRKRARLCKQTYDGNLPMMGHCHLDSWLSFHGSVLHHQTFIKRSGWGRHLLSVHCEGKLGLVPSSWVTANKHWIRFWAQNDIGVYRSRQVRGRKISLWTGTLVTSLIVLTKHLIKVT